MTMAEDYSSTVNDQRVHSLSLRNESIHSQDNWGTQDDLSSQEDLEEFNLPTDSLTDRVSRSPNDMIRRIEINTIDNNIDSIARHTLDQYRPNNEDLLIGYKERDEIETDLNGVDTFYDHANYEQIFIDLYKGYFSNLYDRNDVMITINSDQHIVTGSGGVKVDKIICYKSYENGLSNGTYNIKVVVQKFLNDICGNYCFSDDYYENHFVEFTISDTKIESLVKRLIQQLNRYIYCKNCFRFTSTISKKALICTSCLHNIILKGNKYNKPDEMCTICQSAICTNHFYTTRCGHKFHSSCMENYTTRCGHKFHSSCIENYDGSTCPNCRYSLNRCSHC